MNAESANNMLQFSSHEEYEQTLDLLTYNVELHEDDFIKEYDHLNEDALNDMEESLKFNEDLPLELFEEEHKFQSLRKVTVNAENAWLDNSDQPGFSWDDDPDNFTFIDGIEQTLYNPWHEVMINDTIYKYTENGYYSIVAHNPKASTALAYLNNNPELDPFKFENEYEDVVIYTDDNANNNNSNECVPGKINRTERFINGDYSIKAKQKMHTGPVNMTYKTVIKNYKKKGRKWKKRRILSYTGLQGYIQDPYQHSCSFRDYMDINDNRCTYKKRRRGEYAKRLRHLGVPSPFGVLNTKARVKKEGFWSIYKQRDWVVEWVYEE